MTAWQVASLIGGGLGVAGLVWALVATVRLGTAERARHAMELMRDKAIQSAEGLAAQLHETVNAKYESETRLREVVRSLQAKAERCRANYDTMAPEDLRRAFEEIAGQ